MAYIIDGHNLIGVLPDISLAQPDDEARLVDLLLSFRARGAREMIVFFDSNPLRAGNPPHTPARSIPSRLGMEVRYAPPGKTADDAIADFLRASRQPGQYAVVTNDAALIARVKSLGASVLRANEFSAQMARRLAGQGKSKQDRAASIGEAPSPDPRSPAFADLYDEFLAAERARKPSGRPEVDIATLIERLYAGDPQLQEQSAKALGQSRDPRAIGPLRDALTSKDAGLRAAAALALGALHNQAPLNDLVLLLKQDGNSMVREAAAQALGLIGSAKAAPALELAAESDDKSKVRKAARASLDAVRSRKP
ncbi:MAG: NYN domain-containing protein [Nitrososphaerales archaeon]